MPLPVMPFCRATHSGSVKSVLVAISYPRSCPKQGAARIMGDEDGADRAVADPPVSPPPATADHGVS